MSDYPKVWEKVGKELVRAVEQGPRAVHALVKQKNRLAETWKRRLHESQGNSQVVATAISHLAAARMARLAVDQTLKAAALGQREGTVRFNRWNGTLIQALLFQTKLVRKPVSMWAFRLLWPLVTQKRLLMPLVQPKGIYAFYSAPFVEQLAGLLQGRETLEIGAGDGTLSRFLEAAGAAIRATDDHSWAHAISYPAQVEKLDAVAALKKYQPRAVVCSFPPYENPFEARVFSAPSVELYVALVSKHRLSAGNWSAYEKQTDFEMFVDASLSGLVLPPEIEPAVLVFRRL